MAHEKVYAICENKCFVETVTKEDFELLKNNMIPTPLDEVDGVSIVNTNEIEIAEGFLIGSSIYPYKNYCYLGKVKKITISYMMNGRHGDNVEMLVNINGTIQKLSATCNGTYGSHPITSTKATFTYSFSSEQSFVSIYILKDAYKVE